LIIFRYLIISLTLALCNSPEIYNYEIESDQDSEVIDSKLQISTYIDDEKVEVNFQLFPKHIEKIQSYELLFDMKFRENYNSEFNGVCIGPDWDLYGPGEFSVSLKKETNFKTKLIGQIHDEIDDRCNTYYYYLRFFNIKTSDGRTYNIGVATDYAGSYPNAPNIWKQNENNEIELIFTSNIERYSINFELSK